MPSPPAPATPLTPPQLRQEQWRLALFGAATVVAVAFGFVYTSVKDAGDYIQHYGYYGIAATFAWFVYALTRVGYGLWRELPPPTHREGWQAAGLIAACTVLAACTIPYGPKVLYDEYVLQGTAWSMHANREVGTVVRAYEVGGVFSTVQAYLDKRPYFFPFILSLVHDLTGYRVSNAFALNTALMPGVLALVYLYARRLVAHAAALAALVALGTFSLLAHNATGAGMELLNLVMILLTLHLVAHWLAAPDEPRLAALVLSAVLLAQTRYESSLYVAPVALAVLEGWRRAGRLILPPAAVLGPVLLIPCALHSTYLSGTPILWELRANEASRFGFQYLTDNLAHAWHYFFDLSGFLTNSWWLFGAGLIAFGALLFAVVRSLPRWRTARPEHVALVLIGAAIAGNLLLLQFYYWGQLDDPIAARLSLPFAVLIVICLAVTVQRWSTASRPLAPFAVGGAVLAAFAGGLIANARHTGLNLLERELEWESRVVAARTPGTRLIVTNKSALVWFGEEIASAQIERAFVRAEMVKFNLDHHNFSEVLVLQTYRPTGPAGDFQLDPIDRLPASYVLEPVAQRRFGTHLARISRVAAIHLLAPEKKPPAGQPPTDPAVAKPAATLALNP